MQTRRRVTLAVLWGCAACGGSDGSTEPVPLEGSYTLRSVNGHALPAAYPCGGSVTSGRLEITADSVFLRFTTGQGTDAWGGASEGSYEPAPGEKLVVSFAGFTDARDTVSVLGGGRLTDRAWLPTSAACSPSFLVQVDLGFTHD